jgi:hypothetical protein
MLTIIKVKNKNKSKYIFRVFLIFHWLANSLHPCDAQLPKIVGAYIRSITGTVPNIQNNAVGISLVARSKHCNKSNAMGVGVAAVFILPNPCSIPTLLQRHHIF